MRRAPVKKSLRNQATGAQLPLERFFEALTPWFLAYAICYVGYQALTAAIILSRAGAL